MPWSDAATYCPSIRYLFVYDVIYKVSLLYIQYFSSLAPDNNTIKTGSRSNFLKIHIKLQFLLNVRTACIRLYPCIKWRDESFSCHVKSFWHVLFSSYKFAKGFLAITFLLLLISSWIFRDVCQRFLWTRNEISVGSDKKWDISP